MKKPEPDLTEKTLSELRAIAQERGVTMAEILRVVHEQLEEK